VETQSDARNLRRCVTATHFCDVWMFDVGIARPGAFLTRFAAICGFLGGKKGASSPRQPHRLDQTGNAKNIHHPT
jgi:hypothetical protein